MSSVEIDNRLYDMADVFRMLQLAISDSGSIAAFADGVGVSRQFAHQVMNAQRPPSRSMLSTIGLRRVERFQVIGVTK